MGLPTTLRGISATAGSNSPAGTDVIGSTADDYLRSIQAVIRQYLASVASNIASATTTDLSTADGFWVTITGTTPITGLGTESAGIWYGLTFNGALTLTHNGTSLILPGAANITTAAGDTCFAESLGSGNWRIWSYQRAGIAPIAATQSANTVYAGPASGAAAAPTFRTLVGADGVGLVLLDSKTASTSASLDFTTGINSTYDEYELHFADVIPATNAVSLGIRVSEDGGSTYKAGASDYRAGVTSINGAATQATLSGGQNAIYLIATANGQRSAATGGLSGVIRFYRPSITTNEKTFVGQTVCEEATTTDILKSDVGGRYQLTTNAINAVRVIYGSGNITSGSVYLYGVRKS